MVIEGTVLTWILAALFAAGVAWATIFIKERALGKQVADLEKDFLISEGITNDKIEAVSEDLTSFKEETADRLARIETKIDLLLLEFNPKKD